MTHNITHYKGYSNINLNNIYTNISINSDKNYFILKTFNNFIEKNNITKQEDINKLYSYINKLSDYYIAIKYNQCNYDHILDDNDKKIIEVYL